MKKNINDFVITEGNTLIVEAMGFIVKDFLGAGVRCIEEEYKDEEYYDWIRVENLTYYASWDSLMSVVEKIKTVLDMKTIGKTLNYLMVKYNGNIDNLDSLEDLWFAVVSYLKELKTK